MKLLMIGVLSGFLTGCTVHAPPAAVQVGVHSEQVRVWVWVGGYWKNGRWVGPHWKLSFVDPILVHSYPALYVTWQLGHHGPPPRPHKKWVKKHRRHRR
jgi:hypothetical protein